MKAMTQATARLLAPIRLRPDDRLHLEITKDGDKFTATIFSVRSDGSKSYASYEATGPWIARIPERKELKGFGFTQYELAATDYTVAIIDALWPAAQLIMDDETRLVYEYLLLTIKQQELNAEAYAKYQEEKAVPNRPLEMHPDRPLAAYQQVAVHNALQSDGYALFMEQGTGKTPCVIARVCNEARKMREGFLDYTTAHRTEVQLRARFEAAVRQECADIDEDVKNKIESKKAKLDAAARKRAERIAVELHYEGSAIGALSAAKKVVQDAEDWLNRQMLLNARRIAHMAEVYRTQAEVRKASVREQLRIKLESDISKLQPTHVPGQQRMYRALIVAPNNVRLNWQKEFARFATVCGNVTVIRGGMVQRITQLTEALIPQPDCEYTVVVCSYETLCNTWVALQHIEWDLAVLDEAHYIKWPETQRAKAAMKLRDISRARMVLTGTPISNSPLDLYSLFEFLGRGWSGFASWKAFKTFYGVFQENGDGMQKLVGVQNKPFMKERLARQSFIVRKVDALPDLPEKVYDVVEVEMTARQQEVYDQVASALALEIENELDSTQNKAMTINNILTKLLRLAQITSGFIVWDEVADLEGNTLRPKQTEFFGENPKLDALIELLKEKGPNSKTIIWACWTPDIKAIVERCKLEGIDAVSFYGGTSEHDRQEAERRFNCDPSCKVFIGNAAAGGTGLNLIGYPPGDESYTTNCDHVVYYSQNWSMTARAQSEDRAHRRGTRTNVRITDLCVPETIDEQIRDRVMAKVTTALEISDIREILSNVLRCIQA